MARKYKNVQGTNDFLVAAIGLTLLGLWAVRDAWFPTPKILEKHPLVAEAVFVDAGQVEDVLVEVGTSVSSNSPIASLSVKNLDDKQQSLESRLTAVEDEISRLSARVASDSESNAEHLATMAEKNEAARELKRQIAGIKQTRMRNILRSEFKGKIRDIDIAPGEQVEEGTVAAVIDVKDHFYTFNQSLAIGSLIGALICAIVHIKLR